MSRSGAVSTVRHKVGKCPACRDYLWADVTVLVTVSEPVLDDAGKPSAYAVPMNVAAEVARHACDQREEMPEWEADLLRETTPTVAAAAESETSDA